MAATTRGIEGDGLRNALEAPSSMADVNAAGGNEGASKSQFKPGPKPGKNAARDASLWETYKARTAGGRQCSMANLNEALSHHIKKHNLDWPVISDERCRQIIEAFEAGDGPIPTNSKEFQPIE